MRKIMHEQRSIAEQRAEAISSRNQEADRLFEKWSKNKTLNESNSMISLYDKNPAKAKNLGLILENQWNWMKRLTETQISSAFSTTPENVMRVVRLGYPNSVRSDIFLDWPMQTARDSIYYVKPIYASTARGATANNITHESASYRYASEKEEESLGTGDGSTTTFTLTVANPPLRPYTVEIMTDEKIIGNDDGAGSLSGTGISTGTVNYTTGAISLTFTTAPVASTAILIKYNYDSEVSTQYTDIKSVELTLTAHQFRAQQWPLYISWSKMTELLLNTTLDIDAEESLLRSGAEELKKSLDFDACRLGYRYALKNTGVTFDADFAAAGADSEVAHAQSITRKISAAGNSIYATYQRGGVSKIYGAPDAVDYLMLHNRFKEDTTQPRIGVHKIGSLDGVDVYKAPTSLVPAGKLVCVWKNENEQTDSFLAFGTLIPLYQTQTLEYKEAYKETGLYHFGDYKALNSGYGVILTLNNLP